MLIVFFNANKGWDVVHLLHGWSLVYSVVNRCRGYLPLGYTMDAVRKYTFRQPAFFSAFAQALTVEPLVKISSIRITE